MAAVMAIAGTLLFAGCATRPLTREQKTYPVEKVDARGIFLENCATCHGKDGQAKTLHGRLVGAWNLTAAKFQNKTTNDEIREAIMTGPAAMPSFEKKLSSSEIEALVVYVRSLKTQ